jgi:hypothetical protein
MQATTTSRNVEELKKDLFEITRCIYGNWMSQVTYVFAELGVADQLIDGPKNIEQLAEAMNVHAGYLKRTLRCAFELGYLTFDNTTSLYYLTPKGELLGSNHPHSKREEARLNGAGYRYHPWGNLINILRYGMKEEYSPTYKNGTLDYLKDKPDLFKTFHKALLGKSRVEDDDIIKDFDFSSFTRVMDIGSGKGSFVRAILDRNPHLKGAMFDLKQTFETEVEEKYKDRLIQIDGNFFDGVPDYADVYTMKNVIHNWPEAKAMKLLGNVRKAMLSTAGNNTDPARKRLLIVENVVPENDDHKVANWMDLNFMILIDGAERTIEEYGQLGAKCGLHLEQAFETKAGRHILSFALA